MVKMSQLASASAHQPKRNCYDGADRISQLPEEVLLSILCLVSVKEAVRTSIISRRWKRLWTSIPSLNFDGKRENLLRLIRSYPPLTSELFVSQVNHVLDSYQGQFLNEFIVRFELNENFRADIDRWVGFALERRVQKLELEFRDFGDLDLLDYSLPLLSSIPVPSCSSLKILGLKYLNITEQVLDDLLSNCPFLEQLFLIGSNSLVDLRFHLSLRLQYLEIADCLSLSTIKVEGKDLVSFKYFGKQVNLQFGEVPNLVKVSLGEEYCENIYDVLKVSSCVSRLEKLILNIQVIRANTESVQFPTLSHLEELELIVCIHEANCLWALMSLIKASPSLCRLVLKLRWFMSSHVIEPSNEWRAPKCPHQCLKIVELVDFCGDKDYALAEFLIENAVMLKKIIIHPYQFMRMLRVNFDDENTRAARKCAEDLKKRYLLGDKLVIL